MRTQKFQTLWVQISVKSETLILPYKKVNIISFSDIVVLVFEWGFHINSTLCITCSFCLKSIIFLIKDFVDFLPTDISETTGRNSEEKIDLEFT